jgi:DNA-binding MarR family transcriptional regulator
MTDKSGWDVISTTTGRIVRTLFRSRNHIWDNDHRIVERLGLTWAQFDTLVALRRRPPPHRLSPTELYDAVQVTSGGLTKMLDGLEQQGYLIRMDNPSDRRSRFAELTSGGKRLVEKIVDELIRTNGGIFDHALSSDEQQELARLLEKLCAALDRPDASDQSAA